MRKFWIGSVLLALLIGALDAAIVQQQAGVLAFEAEQGVTLINGPSGSNFSIISTTTSAHGKLLPGGTPAVGEAGLYSHRVGSNDDAFVSYELAFIADGTYSLYTRYSLFDLTDSTNYGNEDSFYSPTAFNQAAVTSGSWNTEALFYDPVYHPTNNPLEGNTFLWDKGASSYTISGASEENPVVVTFTIRNREGGSVLDRFIFSTTNYTITQGQNTALDAIVSVPEPNKTVLLTVAFLGLISIRRRGF